MNMDRLKEYMQKWGTDPGAAKPAGEDEKRKSGRLVAANPGKDILLLVHDPLRLAQISATNDRQPDHAKFRLSRCQTFRKAVETLLESEQRLIVVAEDSEKAEEGRIDVSGLDFLLVLKGVMPQGDSTFLLRKQAILKESIPGDTSEEKLTSYKILKKDCDTRPIIYLTSDQNGPESRLASRVHNVKSVAMDPPGFANLFLKLGEALLVR